MGVQGGLATNPHVNSCADMTWLVVEPYPKSVGYILQTQKIWIIDILTMFYGSITWLVDVGGIPNPLKNDGVRQLGWWNSPELMVYSVICSPIVRICWDSFPGYPQASFQWRRSDALRIDHPIIQPYVGWKIHQFSFIFANDTSINCRFSSHNVGP